MKENYLLFKKYFLLLQTVNYRNSVSDNKPIGQVWWESKGYKWPKDIFSLIFIIIFYSLISIAIIYSNSLDFSQTNNPLLHVYNFFFLCVVSDSYLEKNSDKEGMRSFFNLLPISNKFIYNYLLLSNFLGFKLYCLVFYIAVLCGIHFTLTLEIESISIAIALLILVFLNYIIFTAAFQEIFHKTFKDKYWATIKLYLTGIPLGYALMFPKEYNYEIWDSINEVILDNFNAIVLILILSSFLGYSATIVYLFKRRLA
jgi:hypothetical protein